MSQEEDQEEAGPETVKDPHVPSRGHQGHRAQLPVVAEDGGAEEGERIEDPEVGEGEEPDRDISELVSCYSRDSIR